MTSSNQLSTGICDDFSAHIEAQMNSDYEETAEIQFEDQVVSEVLASHLEDPDKIKLNGNAEKMVAEMIKVFVNEAILRSIEQGDTEGSKQITPDHLEKILPQLLMDTV